MGKKTAGAAFGAVSAVVSFPCSETGGRDSERTRRVRPVRTSGDLRRSREARL